MMKHILILCSFAVAFAACSGSKKSSKNAKNDKNKKPATAVADGGYKSPLRDKSMDSLLVSMERTACFGKCPTYKITIFQRGFFVYSGYKNVMQEGDYKGQLTMDQVKKIMEMANNIRIFEFKDEYKNDNLVDLPSTLLKLNIDGKVKEINDGCYETPSELIYFERLLDDMMAKTELTKVNPISQQQ